MKKKQNIIVVIPYDAYPAQMGGKKSSAEFNYLLSKYFEVHVATTKTSAQTGNPEITIHRILGEGKIRYINPLQFFRLKKLAKSLNVNTLIFVQPYFGWLAVAMKWFANKKLIFKSENIEGERWRSMGKWWWKGMKFYEGFSHRQADLNFWITADDEEYAKKNYKIDPAKNQIFTYGTFISSPPTLQQKAAAKKTLPERHLIPANHHILLFNGTLNYQPNTRALELILHEIAPQLEQKNFPFTILICGKDLPEHFNNLKDHKNVVYAGFVDNIEEYYLGSDVFLNPVNEGGGIKTKLVDALANNLSSVSTKNGAIGVPLAVCGEKLIITQNIDMPGFTQAVINISEKEMNTPPSFYQYFNYDNNAEKIVEKIRAINDK